MKKGKVRCFRGYARVGHKYNVEVFYTVPDMYYTRLFSCLSCGEIFFADQENIDYVKPSLEERIREMKCPRCASPLARTLKPYPDTFLTEDGAVGHHERSTRIPPEAEGLIMEFWDLYSAPPNS